MDQSKNWYRSAGVWGSIMAIAAPVVGQALKVTITPDDMQTTANLIVAGVDVVSGAVALWGRVRATKLIA
jgi:hypothetical protein